MDFVSNPEVLINPTSIGYPRDKKEEYEQS